MNNTLNKPTTSAAVTEFSGSCVATFDPKDHPDFDIDADAFAFYDGYLDDDKLSDDEVDDVLPLVIEDLPEDVPFSLVDQGINWAVHARYFLAAWGWFAQIFEQYGHEFTYQLYMTFTAEQKAILQRGFEIADEDAYPPLLGREQYVLVLETNFGRKSPFDFPVRRIKNDPVQLSGMEPNMDSQAAGAFLH